MKAIGSVNLIDGLNGVRRKVVRKQERKIGVGGKWR
jgi:hypothetical protein